MQQPLALRLETCHTKTMKTETTVAAYETITAEVTTALTQFATDNGLTDFIEVDSSVAELVTDRMWPALEKVGQGEDLTSQDWNLIESSSTYVLTDMDLPTLDAYTEALYGVVENYGWLTA